MPITATAWWMQKSGNATSEYEDAFAIAANGLRFAVADGASETSFAKQWAELLVEAFVAEPPQPDSFQDWLSPLQSSWQDSQRGKATAWYAEQKARDGAFSSLLGLTVAEGRWQALASGDSCLFVVRAGKLLRAFPFERAEQFSNSPVLLSSRARANGRVLDQLQTAEGELQVRDRILLMTDALAHWFLVEAEMGRRPWAALGKLTTVEQLGGLVDCLRAGGALRNDDVTLVSLEVAA